MPERRKNKNRLGFAREFAIFAKKNQNMKVAYKTMLELIKQNVHEVDATAQVWLYGSRVRGEAREDSDWDILGLSQKMVKTGQVIQLFAYGMKDWHSRHAITPFYQSVQSEAVLL